MLEVEDVEDVACIVDDMEATDRSQSLVLRKWSEGRVEQGSRVRIDGRVVYSDGARLLRPPSD
jgi:hypothetical protein